MSEPYTVRECRGHFHVEHCGEDVSDAMSEAEARSQAALWNRDPDAAVSAPLLTAQLFCPSLYCPNCNGLISATASGNPAAPEPMATPAGAEEREAIKDAWAEVEHVYMLGEMGDSAWFAAAKVLWERIDAALRRDRQDTERDLQFEALLRKSVTRFKLLHGRMAACDEYAQSRNDYEGHKVSLIEIPGWIQETEDALAAARAPRDREGENP